MCRVQLRLNRPLHRPVLKLEPLGPGHLGFGSSYAAPHCPTAFKAAEQLLSLA